MSFPSISKNQYPLITIILPTLNSSNYISAALESIIIQDYPNLEYIVVDGGSTDNTIDIAKSYSCSKLLINPGEGLYASLNEGIQASTGEIICFLNSDDILGPGILKKMGKVFVNNEAVEIVCGDALLFEDDGCGNTRIVDDFSRYSGKTFDIQTLLYGAPMINAHFFKSDVFKKTGVFDESYSIAADREFMIRCFSDGLRPLYIPDLAYMYRRHPGSMTLNSSKKNAYAMGQEHLRISKELLNSQNEELRHQSTKARDDASLSVLAACLRDLQPARLIKFYFQHSLEDPSFTLRLPGAVIRKMRRRLEASRQMPLS